MGKMLVHVAILGQRFCAVASIFQRFQFRGSDGESATVIAFIVVFLYLVA